MTTGQFQVPDDPSGGVSGHAAAGWPDAVASEEVSPEQLEVRLARAEHPVMLIDCREDDEFAFNRIEGARQVPLSRWQDLAPALLKRHPDETFVVYCHHGVRSLRATRWVRAHGHRECFSLAGGIDQWSERIDPGVPRY